MQQQEEIVNIGARVRAYRKDKGISQEELGRRAGTTLGTVSKLENGAITNPYYSTLKGIARALNVGVGDICD